MRDAPQSPRLHLFVCTNRRQGSPLGPGCADRGDVVYDALKREVARSGATNHTWITKTHCLGICPKSGATVARYPARAGRRSIETEVAADDAMSLLEATPPVDSMAGNPDLAHAIDALEELQRKKVLALARRLKPGLTPEDVQNPHDFPELHDPDWHYADGVLTGIASVKSALAALMARTRGG